MEKELTSLIALARDGDEDAFALLTEKYKPLLVSMAAKYYDKSDKTLHNVDDFLQEATIAFYSALSTYKSDGDVTFGLYAKICIRNKLVSMLRKTSEKRRRINTVQGSDPIGRMVERESLKQREKQVSSLLSELEKNVLSLYFQGMSYADIAKTLGKTTKTVDNALCRIKRKVRNSAEDISG